MNTSGMEFVKRIWNLCHILRGDGVSYHEYISELTYLLFLKIAEETGTEDSLPAGCRWQNLVSYEGEDLLAFYREMLTYLGGHAANPIVQEIYAFPTTVFSHSENLRGVVEGISKLDWHSVTRDGMGDIYEGLLARNSQDSRSGAGQYFTPRSLVDCMVNLIRPKPGERIQDPACGTGGFLISANQFVYRLSPKPDLKLKPPVFEGMEIEKGTYRICQMNSFLHELNAKVVLGDALTSDADVLNAADVILANPPFGNKAGSARKMRDFLYRTSNKQLAFIQHIVASLDEGGRAAVVIPDNVLFEGGTGKNIRTALMESCDLHTVLRLPNGIFYSQGVNTNVLFFSKFSGRKENSASVWIYDLRSDMPRFGKTRPLLPEHFLEFENVYGTDPHGRAPRDEMKSVSRWKKFSREQIANQDERLDISWMSISGETAEGPEINIQDIAASILFQLESAVAEIHLLAEEFSEEGYR